MNQLQLKTVLVSKPGRMCHIVEALLKTNPQLYLLEPIEQTCLTLKYMVNYQPELVIYIHNIVDETSALLKQLSVQFSQVKFIVLANSVQTCPKHLESTNFVALKSGSTEAILSAVSEVVQAKQKEVQTYGRS